MVAPERVDSVGERTLVGGGDPGAASAGRVARLSTDVVAVDRDRYVAAIAVVVDLPVQTSRVLIDDRRRGLTASFQIAA